MISSLATRSQSFQQRNFRPVETPITPNLSKRDDSVVFEPLTTPSTGGNELSELARTLRKRWPPAVAVATTVFAAVAYSTVTETPQYKSETLILLDNEASAPVIPGVTDTTNPKNRSTEIQILQSHALVSKAISELPPSYSNLSVAQVVRNLSIRQAGQADVLIVAYTDTEPERAKAILEALGSTYVDYSLERQRSQASNAVQFIEDQLPEAQKQLKETASAIQTFRERYGIVDPDGFAATVLQRKQALETQGQEVEIALNRSQRQYEELQRQMMQAGQNPQTALVNSILSQDTVYQKLASQLKEIEAKYTLERTRFYDTHPVVQNLQQQRDSMLNMLQYRAGQVLGSAVNQVDLTDVTGYGSIQQNLANQLLQVETELAAQKTQLETIRKAQGDITRLFEQIPQLQQVYAEMQREFNVKSGAVNNFLAKLQDLQIAEAQETAPWRVLEPPYLPKIPVSPNVRRGLMMGLIAGGLLGVGAAVLLERTDQRVKRLDEAKELTALPLLGVVPKVSVPVVASGYSEDGQVRGYYGSAFTEALRSVALNLRFLGANGQVKTLALTSATPGEGKSTLTYNLGQVLAELGQRVLIVDADMRKPTIHQFLKQTNTQGLSSAIATERSWRHMIYTDPSGNLDILTAGPMPPNPVALLESGKITQLLAEWRELYDYVLLDTTPTLGLPDIQSVAVKVDAVVLVAAIEHSTRAALSQSMEILRRTRCNLAGLIVNQVSQNHDGYYYSSYYSYYDESKLQGGKSEGENNGHSSVSRAQAILNDLWRMRS